jgi:hypothetical protein
MNTISKAVTGFIVALAVVAASVLVVRQDVALGSVVVGNEYNATNTATMAAGPRLLRTGPSVLGSVVVSSSSATTFKVWNATSTLDIASTTPVQFVASPANGTYTFDASFERGIVVELPAGYNGSYTVTWR